MAMPPRAKAMHSEAERIANLAEAEREAWFRRLSEKEAEAKLTDWSFWRRPEQAAPEGDWRVWLLMAGRGFGKTRAGAEWVRGLAESHPGARIALVGSNLGEARSLMVEGESGLLAIAPDATRPAFEPSLRRLSWPNGAIATLYSAAEPESLRGPEHHFAWADEIGKWERGSDAWTNLALTLRIGDAPRIAATTTPRPSPLLLKLAREAGVVVRRGSTAANAANLAETWLAAMQAVYGGTRLGRQELGGELLAEAEGALWNHALIERCRGQSVPPLRRVVVGVDPPAGLDGDACGIVAAGLGEDGRAHVLADASVAGRSPEGWARAVAETARAWAADRVIAEKNNGGEMVAAVLRAADIALPVTLAHASRGKAARAEPVAALYETGRARHAGLFPELEDQMCGLVPGGAYAGPGRSPDRADALVWALTELMLGPGGALDEGPRVRVL